MLQFSSLEGREMEAANHSKNSAMETENHVKHGTIPKSLISKVNFSRTQRNSLTIKMLLLLLTVCFPHIFSAQNAYIAPEIKPYVEFIEKCNTSPVDYIMELFEKYDVVVLGERDHRDTTQYALIQQIISDPRFIDKVGNVLTEVGVYNMRGELNSVLQADYQNDSDFEKALAEVVFNIQWLPLWEKTNYTQFLNDVYRVNKNLPTDKKLNVYPTDVQFSWEQNKNITADEFRLFLNTLEYRDLVMGNNAADALLNIFSGSGKKALVIYNWWHSFRFHENTEAKHSGYQVIADRFPGQVVNVALNWAILEKFNGIYTGLTNNGKWDAAFAACGNKSIGFDLAGTIFGDDTFDLFDHAFADKHTYKDVYHGFIFYKPASEWISASGVPIFRHLDESYVKNELVRRLQVFQNNPNITEEFKEMLYDYAIGLSIVNIFEGESLEMIKNLIEMYHKP